jgi:alpha-D-xyloside xylohydrolase
MRTHRIVAVRLSLLAGAPLSALAQGAGNQPPALLSDLVDVSRDFRDYTNAYYLADSLASFDPATGSGLVQWRRHQVVPRLAFNNMEQGLRPFEGAVFPAVEYPVDP